MNNIWFKKLGWLYVPVHAMGLLVCAVFAIVNLVFLIVINNQSDSVGEMLMRFFVYFTCASFWWKWIAEKTS